MECADQFPVGVLRSNNPTYRKEDENDHQSTHRDRTRPIVLVSSEEKEGCQGDLLDVHPNENVLHRLGEE